MIKQFELVYEKLKEERVLLILSCPNDFLGELIDRAVNRIKPFKEGKSEFRDAVTWLTYSNYIGQYNLSDCYFISNNTNDFLDDKKEKFVR
ncbi:PIN domain-containing protein [Peribacillus sp. SCS-26]|uniref:PIN domain-containing protein n=1 Tax=Paraperibacillus marinus TaxID=3115295 RepID=UPI003905CA1E